MQQLLMLTELKVSLVHLRVISITGDAGRNILHGGEGGDYILVEMVRT